MKKPSIKIIHLLFISVLLLAIPLNHRTAVAKEKKVLLKIPVFIPTALPILGDGIKYIEKEILREPNRSIQLKIYEPGKLIPPFQILDAVSTGKVNAGYSTALYWTGKMPAAPIFSCIPFGMTPADHYSWILHGGGLQLYQEMYDQNGYNVKVIPAGIVGPEGGGWYRNPLKTPNDIKGLKIRFFGLGGDVMSKLGASVIQLPGGELYLALERGVIDAAEYSTPYIDTRLGFYKVAKYYYYPSWHQPAFLSELLVNKDVWNKMSHNQKEILTRACHENVLRSITECKKLTATGLEELKNSGAIINPYPDNILKALKRGWEEVAHENSSKDPFFRKVLHSYRTFQSSKSYYASASSSYAHYSDYPSTPFDPSSARAIPKKYRPKVLGEDTKPPKIKIYSQRGVKRIPTAKHTIIGLAEDDSGVAIVEVNRKEAQLDEKGNFSATILLKPGINTVVITATDVYENQATKTIEVERSSGSVKSRPAAEAVTTDNYFALLISIENYQSSSISDLNQPINDAYTLKDVLQTHYIFDPVNIILLENPNRDKIIDTFDQLGQKITKNDNLLIFYAGHGYWDKRFKQGYWLPSNASRNSRSKWLSNSTIRDYIRGIQAKHTLLISDACFSGGIFKTRTAFDDAPPAAYELYKLPSRKAMTSGTLTEVPDRSVFVEYLVKRLKENKKKYLSSEQLFIAFKNAVINNSPTRQIPQFGEIREAGDEGGDFIFVNRK